MQRRVFVIGAAAAAAAGSVAVFGGGRSPETLFGGSEANAQAQTPEQIAALEETLRGRGYLIGDVERGDPNAPVTMIEYASLSCPACRAFHQNTMPALKANYIDTGKMKLIIREIYFDRLGLYASAVARASGQPSAFHAFVDVFLEQQRQWNLGATDAQVAQGVQVLKRIGLLGGVEEARIDAALTDNEFLNYLFTWSQRHAQDDAVQATPTLIIGDVRFRGAESAETVGAAIDAALEA